ncbi:MAG: hypothetical protein V7642_4660 [Burkholderiales bacterium]|jgi:hypothetical protein
MKFNYAAAAALSILCVSMPVHAQFGGLSNPLGGGKSSSAPAADPDAVKKAIGKALASLSYANGKYAEALGDENKAAQLKEIGDQLSNGTLGVNGDSINKVKDAAASLAPEIKKHLDDKTKLSDAGKKAAGEALAFHVKGTAEGVAGSKMLKSALESKSPMVLSALASLKDFPALLAQWSSTTGSVFSYMQFNGLDVSKADKAIKESMKDA